MKIRVSAIRRKPVDTAGLLSTLVDLSLQLRQQQSRKQTSKPSEASKDEDGEHDD